MRDENSIDRELLIHLLKGRGNNGDWDTFVRRHDRTIRARVAIALRRFRGHADRADVEDVASEVWCLLLRKDLRKLRQYDAARGLTVSGYLGLIAARTTVDFLRAQKPRAASLDELTCATEPATFADPMQEREDREKNEVVAVAMKQISAWEHSFMVACYQRERPPEELARTFSIRMNTVYGRKFKLRAKLTEIVTRLEAQRSVAA